MLALSSSRLSLWKTASSSCSSSSGAVAARLRRCSLLSSPPALTTLIAAVDKFHHHHHHLPCPPISAVTRCSSSNSAAASQIMRRIPPNLTIDADSSFAPQAAFKKKKQTNKQTGKQAAKRQIPSPPISISSKEETEKDEKKNKQDSDSDSDDDDNRDYNDDSDDEDEEEEDEFFLPTVDAQYAIPLPERLHVPIHTLFAPQYDSHVGTIWLEETVFGRNPIRVDLMKQAVVYFRNKKRGMRKAVTKTISQVSGSGRKLRPQKGQGMARVGHSRPPHFRGGAKAHGPKNTTNYGKTKLNKKVRKLALCHALSQKLLEGNLILWNQLHDLSSHKTTDLAQLLDPWQIGGRHGSSALILDHYHDDDDDDDDDDDATTNENDKNNDSDAKKTSTTTSSYNGVPTNLYVAATNLNRIKVGSDHVASVYDILKHEKLVLTLAALQQLQSRLKNV